MSKENDIDFDPNAPVATDWTVPDFSGAQPYTVNKRLSDYHIPSCSLGEYIVDDSNFVPMSEALKQLDRLPPASGSVLDGYYDFPKGKDDGRRVPALRDLHEYNDIAEISSVINEQVSEIRSKAKKIQENIESEKKIQDSLKSIDSSGVSDKE